MYELRKASTRKMTAAHEVIEEAIEKRGEGFTVFSIVSAKQNVWTGGVGVDESWYLSPSGSCLDRLKTS